MKYDCSELSYCENGDQYFQNSAKCPTVVICACPTYFLGAQCQLSTRGFGLSLDVILGYQVRPGLSFSKQPLSIKVSGSLTIAIVIISIINGVLFIFTFQRKVLREVSCGIYLLKASIISILTMTVFMLKYFLLIFTPLSIITNIAFLKGHCILIDFLLKVFLQIGDCLNACAAIGRLAAVITDVKLNKTLTRKISKWAILFVCIFVTGTAIQELLYRTLITGEDEERILCISTLF